MDMVGVERAHELWTDGGSATCSTMGQKEGDWFSSDKQHSQMKDKVYRVANFNAMQRKNGEPIAATSPTITFQWLKNPSNSPWAGGPAPSLNLFTVA